MWKNSVTSGLELATFRKKKAMMVLIVLKMMMVVVDV
jgi:hypothetical protein